MLFSLTTPYSIWFVFLAIIIAFFYAFAFYYKEKKFKHLSLRVLFFLAFLRFFSVFILILLLLSPMVKTLTTKLQKPLIVFGIDNSESVKIVNKPPIDSIKTKVNMLINQLDATGKFETKTFSFDSKMYDSLSFDFSGKYTDITNFLKTISDRYFNRNVGAVILITDGIFNKGESPILLADELEFPIYTILIGDTSTYKDLIISELEYNKIVFLHDKFPLTVKLRAYKLKGKDCIVKVYDVRRETIIQKKVHISSNDFTEKINFLIEAKRKGSARYIVEVSHLKGEQTYKNNVKHFAVDVIDKRRKILILYNSPHPDIGALRRSLTAEKNFDVKTAAIDDFKGNLTEYQLIIFHSLPSVAHSISSIWSNVLKYKLPYIFILGTQTDYNAFNALNIGVSINKFSGLFDYAQPFLNEDFDIFSLDNQFKSLLSGLPPLIVPYGEFTIRPNIKVLFYQKIKGINTSKPLIIISSGGNVNAKFAVIFGENIWRWRMFDYRKNHDFRNFDYLISQIIQSVSLNVNKQRFIIEAKKIVPENTDILFKAQLYNNNYQPINKPDVKLQIVDSAGRKLELIMDRKDDFYILNVGSLPVGKYNYVATVKYNGKTYYVRGEFVVMATNIEYRNLRANLSLLYQLSKRTGGRLFYFNNADSLVNYINSNENIKPISFTSETVASFIEFKWIFFLILFLLSLEWFLRKFNGYY